MEDFNLNGYAKLFSLCGDERNAELVPSSEQLTACYAAGKPYESKTGTRIVRGIIVDLSAEIWIAFASFVSNGGDPEIAARVREIYAELNHSDYIFKPTPEGLWYVAEPYYDDKGKLADLIIEGGGSDTFDGATVEFESFGAAIFSSGVADALGKANLLRPTSEAEPLLCFSTPCLYRDEGAGRGFMPLKPSAQKLLADVEWLRLESWFEVADFVAEFASDRPHKVDAVGDDDAYFAAIEARLIAEAERNRPDRSEAYLKLMLSRAPVPESFN